jgi:hypothetical protein
MVRYGTMIEQAFAPLGQTRDDAREVAVRCGYCSPAVAVAVLQRHGDRWRVYRPFRLTPQAAAATGELRGGLVPLTGAGLDLGSRRSVRLRCRRCKWSRHVQLRRLYELADAAWAAGDRVFSID